MNKEDIRSQRKKLGYTQKKLAELLGVSLQTVNGYENGKEIPSTKIQLLEKILYPPESNILNEPTSTEYKATTGYDKKIEQIEEQIKAREEIITLAKSDKTLVNHQREMIKLYKNQIEIIKEAKKNKELEK